MQLIGQIQNPSKRISKTKLKIDLSVVTVTQLFSEMMRIFQDENPELANNLKLEGMGTQQEKEDEKDTKEAIEKDLETD